MCLSTQRYAKFTATASMRFGTNSYIIGKTRRGITRIVRSRVLTNCYRVISTSKGFITYSNRVIAHRTFRINSSCILTNGNRTYTSTRIITQRRCIISICRCFVANSRRIRSIVIIICIRYTGDCGITDCDISITVSTRRVRCSITPRRTIPRFLHRIHVNIRISAADSAVKINITGRSVISRKRIITYCGIEFIRQAGHINQLIAKYQTTALAVIINLSVVVGCTGNII